MADPIGGYVLIDVGAADVHDIVDRLWKTRGVARAHALVGPTDVIAYIQAPDIPAFQAVLDGEVRSLIEQGLIKHTETRLVLMSKGRPFSEEHRPPPKGSAWIFIDIQVGDPEPVVDRLLDIEEVVNAHAVIGPCDIIAYVETRDIDELMRVLDEYVRVVPGIDRTDTRLVLMRHPGTR